MGPPREACTRPCSKSWHVVSSAPLSRSCVLALMCPALPCIQAIVTPLLGYWSPLIDLLAATWAFSSPFPKNVSWTLVTCLTPSIAFPWGSGFYQILSMAGRPFTAGCAQSSLSARISVALCITLTPPSFACSHSQLPSCLRSFASAASSARLPQPFPVLSLFHLNFFNSSLSSS